MHQVKENSNSNKKNIETNFINFINLKFKFVWNVIRHQTSNKTSKNIVRTKME